MRLRHTATLCVIHMCLLACHVFAGSGPTAPSWEWGWDFQHAYPHRGSTKQAAPTKLRQALNRGVLRGSGGTQQQFLGHGDVLERLQHHPGTERKCENTTQPAFQMHRDLNVAWNLWNVLAAEFAGLPRPAC